MRGIWLTSLVLVVGLSLSGWMFWSLRLGNQRTDEARFDFLLHSAETDIGQRMAVYADALRGGQALFNIVPAITRDRWRTFVRSMDMENRYPGLKGMGVVAAVFPENLENFITDVRKERPDFRIKSFPQASASSEHGAEVPLYIITCREPENEETLVAIGLNIAEDPSRREGLERARDSGRPTITNRLFLTVDRTRRSAFVLYAPIYYPGLPIVTVEERRKAIHGWIYASFIAEDLVDAIMRAGNGEVELSLFQGNAVAPENLLYATNGTTTTAQTFTRLTKLELAGRTFTLGWNRSPRFVLSDRSAADWAGASSAVVAVLLATLISSLLMSRGKAREMVVRQDAEITYQKFALDQHGIVAITDARGIITYANDKFCAVSGYSREELVGQNHRILKSAVHPPEFFQQLYATITTGKVWHGEVCNRNKDGSLCWMSATIVPFLGPDGRPEKYVAIRSEITALKNAQEQIRQSQERLASIFNALDEGVLLQESTTQILESNASAERILGLNREQIAGHEPMPAWWQMIDEKEQPIAMEKRPTAITFQTGQPLRGSILGIRKPAGRITWISVNNEPIRDSLGTVRAVVSSFVDITEQRWSENALSEASKRVHLAATIAQIGIWDWDLSTNRVLADERMFEIYGLPRTTDGYLPFEFWRTVMEPEDLPTQMAHLTQTIESCGQSWRNFRIRRVNDGALRYIESQEQVQTDHTGKVVRVIGVNRDVTDVVEAETALLESEARTRLFAEHAPVSVAMFDREMRYLVVSKQWMTDFKLEGASIIGRSHYEVFPDTTERWKEVHRRCLGGAVETNFSESLRQADGSIKWLQWEIGPWLSPNGAVGGIVMFMLDITQRSELEASLEKARDDALAASRLKSEFLAMMSHEIRTPMNGVIGMASLLLQTPLDGRQSEMTQALVNSAERLLVIINDILDFSKIEAGKMTIEPTVINLRDVIEETAALMSAPAHRKNLHFTCDIDPALANGFSADGGRIQQVLANLLGNAVKFTHEGEIAISAKVLRMIDSEASIRIKIADTGIGIPASARERLFQPFMQADGSTTRRFGGTGLGLAICSQLVELMGGRIGYESKERSGSTFWIELCLPRVALPKSESSDLIPPEARVLVVDDYEVNRMVLLRQLATLQVPSEAVASATEALDVLVREADGPTPFSIALVDWSMPHMDGLALSHAIRANPKIANTCLIILSSTSETIEPGVATGLKFHAVLTKPVRETQLKRCLLRVYGRRATATPFPNRQMLGGRGLKLLLAEDNETNQLVAQLMLEQLGHTIEIAENGRAALEWLAAEPFDAVLMDCQMPEMDGYEATRQIRAGKVHGLNPGIPIIALTAYAMPADRTRVLEAGMDDYVPKPLSKETLHAALARCGLVESPRRISRTASGTPLAVPADKVFDPAQRARLQAIPAHGGCTVWDKALNVFLREMPGRLSALTAHLHDRQAESLAIVAHTIAGSSASLGAPALRSVGLALESAARANDWDGAPALLGDLLEAWRRLEPELTNPDKS
jgi:PAS domain S-box-containing protein